MPFCSVNFFLAVAALVSVYWLLPREWRRAWLVFASVVVYLAAGWVDLGLLLGATAVNWAGHRLWPKARAARIGLIVFDVAFLAWFKYRLFLGGVLGFSIPPGQSLIIPLGISFYVFQLIAYQVEILQGIILSCPSFLSFLLYILFFPHHQAGPIMRPHLFIRSFLEGRHWRPGRFKLGLMIAAWGLFKKIWIADFLLAGRVTALFQATEASGGKTGNALLLAVAYGALIYADFSGYSDIAVGIGRMFGFKLDRNFRQPYLAVGPSEFWRRWHVTLSQWIRDFLFLPLALAFEGWGTAGIMLAVIVSMFLAGMWHGAAWTFAVFGLLHGFYLLLEPLTNSWLDRIRPLKYLLFQGLILLAWLPFRLHKAADLWPLLSRRGAWVGPETLWAAAIFAALAAFSLAEDRLERNFPALAKRAAVASSPALVAAYATIAIFLLAGIKDQVMFIYQRF
jgi:alginate O-acetyltransferase complex protein AlgI